MKNKSLAMFVLMGVMFWFAVPVTTRPALANNTYQTLPFSQNWSNIGLITANDDWSGVPGIIGYLGDGLTGGSGVDPQTVLADGTGTVDVIANQTNTGI